MTHSGIAHLTYLIEGKAEDLTDLEDQRRVMQEAANLELVHNFYVNHTANFRMTTDYLKHVDHLVRKRLVGCSIADVVSRGDVIAYADAVADVADGQEPHQIWGRMLTALPSVTASHAQNLIDAGLRCPEAVVRAVDEEGGTFAETIIDPGHKRGKLSSVLYTFFTAHDYPEPSGESETQ